VEGVYWTTSDNALNLELLVTLSTSKDINFIDISPLINIDKLDKPFTLTGIRLYNGVNLVNNMVIDTEMNQKYTVTFDRTTVTNIYFTFSQQNSYQVDTGHFYQVEATSTNSNIYDNTNNQKRIECDMPSVTSLGMSYDPTTKTLINSKNYTNDGIITIDTSSIQNALFNIPTLNDSVEIIETNRFTLGIQDISLALCEYDVTGDYVSPVYTMEQPISQITLESDEYVPTNFDNTVEYIQYFISLDAGQNWLKILPRQKAYMLNGSVYTTYCINSDIPVGLRNTNTYYIDTLLDLYTVQFKISLTRPTDTTYINEGPIVYDYRLNVASDGDYID
jgi:hypothetical protein